MRLKLRNKEAEAQELQMKYIQARDGSDIGTATSTSDLKHESTLLKSLRDQLDSRNEEIHQLRTLVSKLQEADMGTRFAVSSNDDLELLLQQKDEQIQHLAAQVAGMQSQHSNLVSTCMGPSVLPLSFTVHILAGILLENEHVFNTPPNTHSGNCPRVTIWTWILAKKVNEIYS